VTKPLIEDKHSIEWIRIKEYVQKRLENLRTENDGDLDEVETARIRGMILMTKEIIGLDQAVPVIPKVKGTSYY
jgi:hypothetical protein